VSPASKTAGSVADDDLMNAIKAGDQAAARTVVQRHLPAITALARQMLGNEAEAEDVAQEAFLRLWRQADKWTPGRALIITWLRRVASNLCIDRMRAQRTTRLSPVNDPPVAAAQQVQMEEGELRRKVSAALRKLPERQQLALTLCHYQGLSQKEAALAMQISEHALESLLARARRSLRALLEKEWRGLLPDRPEVETLISVKS